jgi:hypothetical protein
MGRKEMTGANGICGYMDEFAIYPGCLSAERVAVHYAAWQPKNCAEIREREQGTPEGPIILQDFFGSGRKTQDREWWLLAFDSNKDCDIDLVDFADFALKWRISNDPLGDPNNWNWK